MSLDGDDIKLVVHISVKGNTITEKIHCHK